MAQTYQYGNTTITVDYDQASGLTNFIKGGGEQRTLNLSAFNLTDPEGQDAADIGANSWSLTSPPAVFCQADDATMRQFSADNPDLGLGQGSAEEIRRRWFHYWKIEQQYWC